MRAPRRGLVTIAVAAGLCLAAPVAASGYGFDPRALGVSPDGRHLYSTDGLTTLTYQRDLASGSVTLLDNGHAPGGDVLTITPDGRFVYMARSSSSPSQNALDILSRDPKSGALTLQRRLREDVYGTIAGVSAIEVSPDGAYLYVTQTGPNALLAYARDEETGDLRLVQSFKRTALGELGELAVSPDGKQVYVANTQNGNLKYGDALVAFSRDPATGLLTLLDRYPSDAANSRWFTGPNLAITPSGDRVYSGSYDYNVWNRDPADGRLAFVSNSSFQPTTEDSWEFHDAVLGTSPDGKSVFATKGGAGWHAVRLTQGGATSEGVTLEHSYAEGQQGFRGLMLPHGMVWSPDGRFAYLAGSAHVSSYEYGSRAGLTVLGWDQASRLMSFRDFETASLTHEPDRRATVTINGGALFTNDPNVSVSFTPPPYVASFRMAAHPEQLDDGRAHAIEADGRYPFRLDTTGVAPRDVRHVHLRVWTRWGGAPIDLSDDIVLDQRPPEIVSASLEAAQSGSVLRLKAKDNRSGVRRMQVTSERSKPGARRPFAKQLKVAAKSKRLYVRVIDGAHNRSPWRAVSRP
jgi:DNA-binding beta-propeller fold protein YncE